MSKKVKLKQGHLTDEEVEEQLSIRYDGALQSQKGQRIVVYIVGTFFFSLFVVMAKTNMEESLNSVMWLILVANIWNLLIAFIHRRLDETVWRELRPTEREHRLKYDTFWTRLHQIGMGLCIVIMLVWGVLEMGKESNMINLSRGLVGVYVIVTTFCIIRLKWLTKVLMEGFGVHKWVGFVVGTMLMLFSGMPVLSGISSVWRVQYGQESLDIFMYPVLIVLILIAMFLTVLVLMAIQTARVLYKYCKQEEILLGYK
ncbi:MAG TPA: hypothetical protein VLL52_22195 [Anaerolineae bacterium]|nr:hypothetical protein [Anaerolineae bacterium]